MTDESGITPPKSRTLLQIAPRNPSDFQLNQYVQGLSIHCEKFRYNLKKIVHNGLKCYIKVNNITSKYIIIIKINLFNLELLPALHQAGLESATVAVVGRVSLS